jgi:hypothetical protein
MKLFGKLILATAAGFVLLQLVRPSIPFRLSGEDWRSCCDEFVVLPYWNVRQLNLCNESSDAYCRGYSGSVHRRSN